jgi:protein TonB
MTRSDAVNWSIAIVLSLLLHGLFFMGGGFHTLATDDRVLQAPLVARFNFEMPAEKTQAVVKEARPVTKQRPVPKVRPVKKTQPEAVRHKAAPDNGNQPAEVVEDIEPELQTSLVSPPVDEQPAVSDGILRLEREQYLQQLLNHIESFKYYPRAARRRSLEGEVRISFILREDGYYEGLSVEGKHSLLEKAARQSLESAAPLPVPPEDEGLSGRIEFVMVYSLKR